MLSQCPGSLRYTIISQNIRRPKPGDLVLYPARFVHCEDFPWAEIKACASAFASATARMYLDSKARYPNHRSAGRACLARVTNLVTLVECQDALLAGRDRFQRLLHPSSAATVQSFHA
jgi:hypothetical protein